MDPTALVNNAGILLEGRFSVIGLDEQLRLFLGPMLERNSGRILNVASIAAFMPVQNLAV